MIPRNAWQVRKLALEALARLDGDSVLENVTDVARLLRDPDDAEVPGALRPASVDEPGCAKSSEYPSEHH